MSAQIRSFSLENAISARNVIADHLQYAKDNVASATGVRLVGLSRGGVIGDDVVKGNSIDMFLICSGVASLKSVLWDGRCQVLNFCFPGDVLVPSFARDLPEVSAYALADTTLLHAKLYRPEANAARSNGFKKAFTQWICLALQRTAIHSMVLGQFNQEERLASFLLEVALWSGQLNPSGSAWLELPMTREEIGDYLGLNSATVTRGLTSLRKEGVIEIKTPRLAKIFDLEEVCRRTLVADALIQAYSALADIYRAGNGNGFSRCVLSDAVDLAEC